MNVYLILKADGQAEVVIGSLRPKADVQVEVITGSYCRISHRVLNIFMTQVMLQCASILSIVRQFEATGIVNRQKIWHTMV